MLNELKQVALQIDELIVNDDFPTAIEPQYLRATVMDYPSRGGKRLRPALLLWCCGLLGGNTEAALYPAMAAELFHNWTLVHDDIIDEDRMRRGQLTTHEALRLFARETFEAGDLAADKFGRNFAILAGDIQQGWALNTILKSAEHGLSAELTLALGRRLLKLGSCRLISGEALDIEFPMRKWQHISTEDTLHMLKLKTGNLLRFCAEAGAAIALNTGNFRRKEIKMLGEFAVAAGIAFQLRDDWLGIFGDSGKTGKNIASDLTTKKPTILLLKTFENLKPELQLHLTGMLGLDEYDETILNQVRTLMRDCGAEAYVREETEKLASQAKKILYRFPDNKYRTLLLELTAFLVNREE
ncbi:MAG: polyprenyl synthetase family protein [Victivallaceae bacterium]|nr:polyprenyl synthetase family protein [Victivallaceae bacterium]